MTLMLTLSQCPRCHELQPPAQLARVPALGLVCRDRASCAARARIRAALAGTREEDAA